MPWGFDGAMNRTGSAGGAAGLPVPPTPIASPLDEQGKAITLKKEKKKKEKLRLCVNAGPGPASLLLFRASCSLTHRRAAGPPHPGLMGAAKSPARSPK